MERPLRIQRSLSKQAELEDLVEPATESNSGAGDRHKTGPPATAEVGKKDKARTNGVCPKAQEEEVKKNIGQGDEKPNLPIARARSNSKVKLLVRSHAMREATSPPPDPDAHSPPVAQHTTTATTGNNNNNNNKGGSSYNTNGTNHNNNNSLSVRPASRHKLNRQGSSRESMDSGPSPCLSRDNSMEYTDSTGTDLQLFIVETINKNYKDRMMMLKIEQELVTLIKDQKRTFHKFQPMSSYQRMLVHRVAAYFGMEHNVDSTGNAVVVSITKGTRVPEVPFREHLQGDMPYPEEPRRSILKRDSSSFEDANFKSPERQYSSEVRRSKSFEEREEEYEKARKRIFKCCDETGNEIMFIQSHESLVNASHRSSHDELRWPDEIQPWNGSESEPYRNHRFVHSDSNHHLRTDRLCKVESFEGGDSLKANSLRMSVSKSYSFGGYPMGALSRGDSCASTASAGARLLTKQDSGSSMSSRISPSSSGYKSQSQRSDATMSATPSPTATPLSHPSGAGTSSQLLSPQGATIMWAVCDMATVPHGSMLINPQTGLPITNSDGSIYRYDAAHPPKMDETKSVSTQITPLPSQPPSPAKTAAPNETAKNTTTTSTSPSFPATPPPPPVSQPGSHVVPYQAPPYQPPPYKTFGVDPSQSHGGYQAPPYQTPPQVDGGGYGTQQPVVFSYNVNMMTPYEQRPPVAVENNMAVNELTGYFVGMNIMSDQQRGGGDTNQSQAVSQAQGYQPNAQQTMYWQPNNMQAQAGMPVYYSMPPQGPPLMTSSPPQHSQPGSAQNSPRYITYPPYQSQAPPPDSRPPQMPGGYMGYGVPGYPPAECLPPLMYAPGGGGPPYFTPPQQPVQYASPHRAPTPPQTPTHTQAVCGPPLVFLNGGGPGYSPVYNPNPASNATTPPGATQYLPHGMPNGGIFRPGMQMMRISPPPPPRPPREEGGAGSKPPYSRSPSVGSNKDSGSKMVRYSSMPLFRMMPGRPLKPWVRVLGDMRGLSLQQPSMPGGGMRLPYPLPPHAPNHRPPPQHYQPDGNRFRRPRFNSYVGPCRPKGLTYSPSNQSKPLQTQSSQQSSPNTAANNPNDTGRTTAVNNGSPTQPRQH